MMFTYYMEIKYSNSREGYIYRRTQKVTIVAKHKITSNIAIQQ